MTKVVLIGAGSVEFTRNILADLCSFEELHGSLTIGLHDIDPERLSYAERAARHVIERTGAGYEVIAGQEREPIFEGADFLVNEIQVGGYSATVTDFEIPKKYGLRQTIADTIGIGGIMRGIRTIPVMIQMAEDMLRVCPEGLLLNYTNPMAMVPWGIWAGSAWPAERTIGICHSVRDTHEFLAETVGVPQEVVRYVTAGFNHQAFVYVFEDKRTGEDLYPRLRAKIDADPEDLGRRVRVEIFRRFGFFPTESSEHSSEYVPWFMHHDDQIERFRIFVDDYISRSDENLEEFRELKRQIDAGEELEIEPTSELASEIIHAITTGQAREVYINVRNDGLIDGLPTDACVEVESRVDTDGLHPKAIGAIPLQCMALNRMFLNVAQLTVRAAVEQSRELVYQAALLDPNTAATLTTDSIVSLVDDLITAHGDLIPEGIRRS